VSVDALQQLAGQPAGRGLKSLVLYGLGKLTQVQCLGEAAADGKLDAAAAGALAQLAVDVCGEWSACSSCFKDGLHDTYK
jgi:hypothetical protein